MINLNSPDEEIKRLRWLSFVHFPNQTSSNTPEQRPNKEVKSPTKKKTIFLEKIRKKLFPVK